jgi:hypothetical protein
MKKFVVSFFILLTLPPALASVISLTVVLSTTKTAEYSLEARVKLLNSGDEPAYNVQVSLLAKKFKSKPFFLEKLNPKEPFEKEVNVSLREKIIPGKYPIVVLVDYTDANGYPFSSVFPSFIVYNTETVSSVLGTIPETSLSEKGSGKLILYIKNSDDVSHTVNIELILPREIRSFDKKKEVLIGPGEIEKLEFEVSSVSATPGSRYTVLASIEYEDEGLHYSSFGLGRINISKSIPRRKEFSKASLMAYTVLFISIIIVLFYSYPKYMKRERK